MSAFSQTCAVPAPLGRSLIAGIVHRVRVVVRAVPSMSVHADFLAVDKIDRIEWSPCGTLVLALVACQGIVHVWSIDDPDWTGFRIDSGAAGLREARFFPHHPRFLLCYSEFGIRCDIYNLSELVHGAEAESGNTQLLLQHVESNALPVYAGRGTYWVLCKLEQRQYVTELSVAGDDITVSNRFALSETVSGIAYFDAVGMVAWDNRPVAEFHSVYMYSTKGELVSSLSLGENRIRNVTPIPNRKQLILGSLFDQTVSVVAVSSLSLSIIATIPLCPGRSLTIIENSPIVFRESLSGTASLRERNLYHLGSTAMNPNVFPVEYVEVTPESSDQAGSVGTVELPELVRLYPSPTACRCGVACVELSGDGRFVAVQTDERSSVVFIIDISKLRFTCVLIHRQPVRSMKWSTSNVLCIASNETRLFLIDPLFNSQTVEFSDQNSKLVNVDWVGDMLIASSKDSVSVVALDAGETDSRGG